MPEPLASADFAMLITGVMPLPPAKSSRSASSDAGVKIPLGGSTVSWLPARRLSLIQLEP